MDTLNVLLGDSKLGKCPGGKMGNIHSLNKYLWSFCVCQVRGNSVLFTHSHSPSRGVGGQIEGKKVRKQVYS